MSFWAFIVPYYEGRLQHYESLDLGRCGECELLAAAREASALRKFLTDLVEEGYTDTEALLRDQADAADRLQRFLSAALETLGPPPERERFYLVPEPVHIQFPSAGKTFSGEISLHDYRFYLSSLARPAEDFATLTRQHWAIENKLHWSLDVTFNEDRCRIRKDHAPENMAALRRLALNLLRQEGSESISVRQKRLLCNLDDEYLMQVLSGAT